MVKTLTAKDGIDRDRRVPGAGESASYTDDAYKEAGAEVGENPLGRRHRPAGRAARRRRGVEAEEGQVLIGFLQPLTNSDLAKSLASNGVTSFAVEAIPRITRAQSMDALSLAGEPGRLHVRF